MRHLGFRPRLFFLLALFALVPSIILTLAWGGAMTRVLPMMSGSAAWDSAASTGSRVLDIARRASRTPADTHAIAAHDRLLAVSVTRARQFDFLAERAAPALLVLGMLVVLLLTLIASPVAGHLSRQLSRPVKELVGWMDLIRREAPLPPPEAEAKGAPEFGLLRQQMRQTAADLEAGRQAALEAERLAAFRESARQVAHELKNPLTPIRLAVERLRRGAPPELAEAVDVLATETARLDAMARSFSQFGRLPEGPVADVDLGEVVRTAARTTVPPELPCSVEVESGVPLVPGHHDALGRAVGNVLLNAVEACEAGGRITVRVAAAWNGAGRVIVVSVRDSGVGIDSSRLARIWEPYVTHKPGGTGLGLAIVKQTVAAHGGRVEAESEPGRGTEIRLIFPAGAGGPTA